MRDEGGQRMASVSARCGPPASCHDVMLAMAIEVEIIPRLRALATRSEPAPAPPAFDVEAYVRALRAPDDASAADHLDGVMAAGAAPEALMLDLFTPAARRLGVMWETDEASFIEVTVALCRIHRALQQFEPDSVPLGEAVGTAIVAAVPGAQHQFGALVAQAFFRRAGWAVRSGPFADGDELLACVGRTPRADLLGLSIAYDRDAAVAKTLIARARKRAPDLFVLVGGPLLGARPDLADIVGADAVAADAPSAVALAGRAQARPQQTVAETMI